MAADGTMYVVDSVSCKVRRLSSASQVAKNITCDTTLIDIWIPSGCNSYDYAFDEVDQMLTPFQSNIYYRYDYRFVKNNILGHDPSGRRLYPCLPTPPSDELDKHFLEVDGDNLVIDDMVVDVNEDLADGSIIKINCPSSCDSHHESSPPHSVWGDTYYLDSSSICQSAIHSGVANATTGGIIQITLERGVLSRNTSYSTGSVKNGITSQDVPFHSQRLFSVLTIGGDKHRYPGLYNTPHSHMSAHTLVFYSLLQSIGKDRSKHQELCSSPRSHMSTDTQGLCSWHQTTPEGSNTSQERSSNHHSDTPEHRLERGNHLPHTLAYTHKYLDLHTPYCQSTPRGIGALSNPPPSNDLDTDKYPPRCKSLHSRK